MTITEPAQVQILNKSLKLLLARLIQQFSQIIKNELLLEATQRQIQVTDATIKLLNDYNSTVALSKNQLRQALVALNTYKNELNISINDIDELQIRLIEMINIPKAKEEPLQELNYNQYSKARFSSKNKINPFRIYTF